MTLSRSFCCVVALGVVRQCLGYVTTLNIDDSIEGRRAGHSTIVLEDSHMLATIGGFNVVSWHDGIHDVDTLSFFNTTTQAWVFASFASELARNHFILEGPFLVDSKQYYVVVTGQNSSTGELCNDSAVLLTVNNESSLEAVHLQASGSNVKGPTPSPRVLSAATVINNEMYMFGGEYNQADGVMQGSFPYSDELFLFTLEYTNASLGIQWHVVHTYVDSVLQERPVPRSGHSFDAIDNSTIMLFGGKHYNFGQTGEFQGMVEYLDDTWLLRVQDRRWIHFDTGSSHPEHRAGHATTTKDGIVYLHGGFSLATNRYVVYDDLWTFKKISGDTVEWEKLVPAGSTTRKAWHSLIVSPSSTGLLLVGGLTSDQTTRNFSLVDGKISLISGITL